MRDLAETNCEIRNVKNLELPPWNIATQEDAGLFDGSRESSGAASQKLGGFLNSECNYAWLSQGTRLVVLDVKAGKCISFWTFSDRITTVSAFPAQLGCVPLLLVGLDNNAIRIRDSVGHLCIFDCSTCNVLTTIQVPAGVEKACVIHGGAEWEWFNEKRPDTVLPSNSGLIFAALRNLQHIVIDINRELWAKSCYQGKSISATLEFVNENSLSAMQNPRSSKIELTYLAHDLMGQDIERYVNFDRQEFETTPLYDENLCSVLLNSTKTGCLITGCLGRVIIWQYDGSIGWISPTFDENAYVTHVALLEPSDDPKPFYYLWVVCQSDAPDSSAVLRMYMLMFKNKLADKSGEGTSLYYNLESEPCLKFELELEQGERVHSLQAIERGNPRDASDGSSRRGEESLLLIGTEERVLLFDLNRWYKEQMPCTMAGCRNPNSVMASYRTRQDESDDGDGEAPRKGVLSCCYVPRSLRECPAKGPHSPEELFFPNSLSLEWVELAENSLTFWLTRGVQMELLREITMAGPIVLVMPIETYRRCLNAGLVPFDSLPQDHSFEVEPAAARELLLSLCLEQRWASLLLRCATEWSDGSAAYLYAEFLRWGVQRASEIKLLADGLCVPLFDQSGVNIGEAEVRTLRHCAQQLECLATVVSRLPNPESDLAKHRRALKRMTVYLQVLLWFYDVGLLPETLELEEENGGNVNDNAAAARIPYPRNKLVESYKRKRRNDCDNEENKPDDILFIDQLVARECLPLREQWARETVDDCPSQGGLYPPPSLQSLLRSFLTDCHREEQDEEEEEDESCELPETPNKHCVVIYLLMDLAMLLEGTNEGVDHLIKYPSAFKLSPSLIKLTQAFWLLDHEDYDRFFKIMTSQLVTNSDIKDWQHKLAIDALLKNDQHKLALIYLRVMKPPLSSMNDQSMLIDLAVEQGQVESAFHARPPSHYGQLLARFFQACKNNGNLKAILQLSLDPEEEEVFLKFLKESGCEETRLIYYLQRGRHTEASDIYSINTNIHPRQSSALQSKIQPISLNLLKAFNNTLPEITKLFANSFCRGSLAPVHGRRPFLPFSMISGSGKELRDVNTKSTSHSRNGTSGIYELAMQKARETCLRPDRGGPGTSNYIPFLAAPYTTINFGPKFAGQSNEPGDANCVTYPEKRALASKRTLRMMSGAEDNNAVVDNKRRKLCNESDVDLSGSDNDTCRFRRLSMSQVCNTPLVQRRGAGDSQGLAPETPHSILKIRQMLQRNSRSPSYNYGQGDDASDTRPLRQIRFSVDRLSGNDDSGLSGNETQNNEDDSGSSKRTGDESCADNHYFNSNLTEKSLRDITILSDTSMTRNLGVNRPIFRKSNKSSTPDTSNTSSNDSTTNASEQDVSINTKKTPQASLSAGRRQSSAMTPTTPYRFDSILDPDTSCENPYLEGPIVVRGNESGNDSEDQSDDDDEGQNAESVTKSIENQNDEFAMEVDQDEEEEEEVRPHSENVQLATEDSEEDQDGDETFQSFSSNSMDENSIAPTADVSGPEQKLARDFHDENSLTENLLPVEGQESTNYSLTKPIFLSDRGTVGFADEECNVTDDDSSGAEDNIRWILPEKTVKENDKDENDKDDFVLSFSNSDSPDEKAATRSFASEELDSSPKNSSASGEQQRKSSLGEIRKVSPRRSIRSVSTSPVAKANESKSRSTATREKRSGSSATEKANKSPLIPRIVVSEDNKGDEEAARGSRKATKSPEPIESTPKPSPVTRVSEPKSENKTARKKRSGSLASEKAEKVPTVTPNSMSEDHAEKDEENEKEKAARGGSKKAKKSPIARKTRAGSVATEKDLPSAHTRSKRAGSVAAADEGLPSAHTRSKRAGSVAATEKDLPSAHTRSKRAGSVAANDESQTSSDPVTSRKTRAGSLAKEDDVSVTARKTRGGSVAKSDEKSTVRKTRASSLAKEATEEKEETKARTTRKRSTRALRSSKDTEPTEDMDTETREEQEEVAKKAPTRKRGVSLPKDVPLEITRPQRGQRASSLLKETILEESAWSGRAPASPAANMRSRRSSIQSVSDDLNDSTGMFDPKWVRASQIAAETAPSSPAANTRSRRSSIQSVPEDFEVPAKATAKAKTATKASTSRNRRAASVDSAFIEPPGKRLTRGMLAKATSILEEVIPEESSPAAKKQQPSRKKRATSVSDANSEQPNEKISAPGKPKRGRKASESKDYHFSPPEQAGDVPARSEGACRTPTFEFSEPTSGQQKFITLIDFDNEETLDETPIAIKQQCKVDDANKNWEKFKRKPRTCFVLPEKRKGKAKRCDD